MTMLHLLFVASVVLIAINNAIFSRAYKKLTGKEAATINFQGLFTRHLNDWVNDPFKLDAFGKISEENRVAVDALKHESARRNCISIALIIVAFLTPRAIWNFPLIPQSNGQALLLGFCVVGILIDLAIWSYWLRTTYGPKTYRLRLVCAESLVTFSMAIVVTIA